MTVKRYEIRRAPTNEELTASLLEASDAQFIVCDDDGEISDIPGQDLVIGINVSQLGPVSGGTGFIGQAQLSPDRWATVEGLINHDQNQSWLAIVEDRPPSIEIRPNA